MAQNIIVSAIVPQKLRGRDNFKEWSLFMKKFLLSQDVWVIIEPDAERPVQEQKKNATALHAILISCEADVFSLIQHVESARDAWDILADSYDGNENTVTSLNIPKKLRGNDNYKEWRHRMKKILSSRGVWDIVEPPAGGLLEESLEDSRRRNATVLHAIQINCSSKVFSEIKEANTAKEAWDTLSTLYGHPMQNSQNIIPSAIVPQKLRGCENYEKWSLFMKNFLVSQDVWDITEKDTEPLDQQADDYRAWKEKNDKALRAIKETCKPQVFVWIRNTSKAVDAWNILTVSYAQPPALNGDYALNKLFEYANKCDFESMKRLSRDQNRVIARKFGSRGFTILHVAALAGNVELVEHLVKVPEMEKEALEETENRFGSTALHYVAIRGIKQMAQHMIERNPKLVEIPNTASNLPVTLACKYRRRGLTEYLYQKTKLEVLCQDDVKYGSLFIKACITSQMLDLAVKALDQDSSLNRLVAAKDPKTGINSLLQNLCLAPTIFPSSQLENQLSWWDRLTYSCIPKPHIVDAQGPSQANLAVNLFGMMFSIFFQKYLDPNSEIYDLRMKHAYSTALLDRSCGYLKGLSVDVCYELGIDRAFDIAVKFGVVEIIEKLVEIYPLLWDRRNEDNRDIIMQSIVNRNAKVFSLYYRLKDSYAAKIGVKDKYGNTLLHLAGMLSPPSVLARLPGAALQMQRELQWFKEVESIADPGTKLQVNDAKKTPEELFSDHHKQLVKEGEKWLKNTATSCNVVGGLIITVVFTAAFTIPGGSYTDIGIPVFLHKKAFKVFILLDAISFSAASTSVLMFLRILTSRYEERDFLDDLPTKLIAGLSTLFISIVAMMVAFCAALTVVLHGMLEIIVAVIMLACIPVSYFMALQFPLLYDLTVSTLGAGIFDRKPKPLLSRILPLIGYNFFLFFIFSFYVFYQNAK